MKLTKPIYKVVGKGAQKFFAIDLDLRVTKTDVLNFTGGGWIDHKFGLVKQVANRYGAILTDQDLLAHDDYMSYCEHTEILLVFTGSKMSASKKRLKNAHAKLKENGIKCKYFASLKTAQGYIERKKA